MFEHASMPSLRLVCSVCWLLGFASAGAACDTFADPPASCNTPFGCDDDPRGVFPSGPFVAVAGVGGKMGKPASIAGTAAPVPPPLVPSPLVPPRADANGAPAIDAGMVEVDAGADAGVE